MVEEVKLDQTQASQATQVLETVSPPPLLEQWLVSTSVPGPYTVYVSIVSLLSGEERADCSVGGVGPEVGPVSRSL